MENFTKPRKKLGEALLDAKLVTDGQIQLALAEQKRTGGMLGDTLQQLGFVTASEISKALASETKTEHINLTELEVNAELLKLIPSSLASQYVAFPIKLENEILTVAMENTFDVISIDKLEKLTGYHLDVLSATKQDILEAIEEKYTLSQNINTLIEGAINAISNQDAEEDIGKVAPLVQLVDRIIINGIRKRATDIHLEPEKNSIRIRYRIDGILYQEALLPTALKNAIQARLKIMSELDVTEHRIPQDGRISFSLGPRSIDIRASTLPTQYGESIVLRILDKGNVVLDLSKLGLEGDELSKFQRLIEKPHGVILVTGPTGSGKTTTLYAALSEMNSKEESIFTLEDPIEYDLAGIRQVQVRPDFGLSFSEGLRSLLRQDPDTILVGEIRDEETAELAIRASLTGHLVLSTLHTNSAVGAIPRLVNMGVESYLLSSALLLIVAQRLVRKVCPHCRIIDQDSETFLKRLRLPAPENATFYKGTGCEKCNQSGYHGRVAIYELLEIDDEIREAMLEKISESKLREIVIRKGTQLMVDDGLIKAANGLTTLSEVQRLVG